MKTSHFSNAFVFMMRVSMLCSLVFSQFAAAIKPAFAAGSEPSTTLIMADSPDPSAIDQTVNVSVMVSGGEGTPTGSVEIAGADTNCTIAPLVDGSGNCNVSFTSSGDKTLTATYSGDDTYASSIGTEPHMVSAPPVNNPPEITEGTSTSVTMDQNGIPTGFILTLNATDADPGDILTWGISIPATNGTASVSGTGTSKEIGYNPYPDYTGPDSFEVQVGDGNGGTDTILVDVTIQAPAFVPSYWGTGCEAGNLLQKVESIDADTVIFTLCRPDVAFLSKIAHPSVSIYPKEWITATNGTTQRSTSGLENPIGTGPYMVSEWVRGTSLTLVKNPLYWGAAPEADTLVFRWSNDPAANLSALQANTIDGYNNVPTDQYATITGDAALQLVNVPQLNTFYIGMNNTLAPFDNLNVRQAVAMGLNRQHLVDTFYPDGSELATHFTPCAIPNGCAGDDWYAYNVPAAQALMAAAELPAGFTTHLYYRNVPRAYLPDVAAIAQEIHDQLLANLNIDAEIVELGNQDFLQQVQAGTLNGFYLLGWGVDYPHVSNFLDYHFGQNSTQFGTPFADIYNNLNTALQYADPLDAQPYYAAANNAIRANVPMVPVVHTSNKIAYRADVTNPQAGPMDNNFFALSDPGGRNVFNWTQDTEPASLFCADEWDSPSILGCEQVTQPLYTYVNNGSAVEPALATSCTPNGDLTSWTCNLRANVKFSDGSDLDANDVVATFRMGLDTSSPDHVGNLNGWDYYNSIFGTYPPEPAPEPMFDAHYAEDSVTAHGWPDGTLLTLEIDDPATTGNPVDYSATATVGPAFWDPSQMVGLFELSGDFDITPGMTLTVSGASLSKQLVISNLTIASINPVTDIITGTAEPGQTMWADLKPNSGTCCRNFQSDINGDWIVDYSQVGLEGEPIEDIGPGFGGTVRVKDVDGDNTVLGWYIPNPYFDVRANEDRIETWEWPLNSTLTLNIYASGIETPPADFTTTAHVDGPVSWGGARNYAEFNLRDVFDLQPGYLVTVSDGETTKSHIVSSLAYDVMDTENDTVSGFAPAGSNVNIWACISNNCYNRHVTAADPEGTWIADWSAVGPQDDEKDIVNLDLGTWVDSSQGDDDGDSTMYGVRIPNPNLQVFTTQDRIEARDWPAGNEVTLTIHKPGTPESEDYTDTATMGPAPWNPNEIAVEFNLGGIYHYQIGDLITVSDGLTSKTHTMMDVNVTAINAVDGTISGTTSPGAEIEVNIHQGNAPNRRVTANGSGDWSVDFSTPWDGQGTYELTPGLNGAAMRYDNDGDASRADWNVPNPAFAVRANNDQVEGWDWQAGGTITVTIEDPSTPQSPDLVRTTPVYHPDWDPTGNRFDLGLSGDFDIQPGQVVTVTDGATTKQTMVTVFAVTGVDVATDSVWGVADPLVQVDLWICESNGCVFRHVTSNEDGNWLADYSLAGPGDDEKTLYDIVPGTGGDSQQPDDDGDGTYFGFRAPNPYIEVAPYSGWLHARDWPLGNEITMTIDDPSTPETTPDITDHATIRQNPYNLGDPNDILAEFVWPGSLTPGPGYTITMTDGVTEKTYVNTNLQVTGSDFFLDTVSGTATPGAGLEICVNMPGYCVSRYVTADGSGNWTADYQNPGGQPNEQETVDIAAGSNGWAAERNANNDQTWFDWTAQLPACSLSDSVIGTVFYADGTTPMSGARIRIEDYYTGATGAETASGPDGGYCFTLPDGNYRIWADSASLGFSREYYNGTILESAGLVNVTEGLPRDGIDFSLDTPTFGFQHLTFNMADPIVAELAVRQAIAHGSNRAAMVAATYPEGALLNSYLPSSFWGYPGAGLPVYDYDPVEARQILTDAGWVDTDLDGIREKGGNRLHIEYYTRGFYAPTNVRSILGPIFVQNMTDIGIEIDVHDMPNLSFLSQTPRPFGIAAFAWVGIDLNADSSQDYFGLTYSTGNESNVGDYSSTAADALLALAAGETTRAGKMTYLQQHQVQVMTDLAVFPLVDLAPSQVITLWHSYTGAEESALNEIIWKAQVDNPGLAIIATYHPPESLYSDYERAVDAGGGPDMFIGSNDYLGNEARAGQLLNLDTYLAGELGNVTQTAIDGMKVNGVLYGVPESAIAVALYYKKSQINTPPTTTAELLALIQSGKTLASPSGGSAYFLYGFWNAFGGQLMDGSGSCTAVNGGFTDALQYFLDLQTAGASFMQDYGAAQNSFMFGSTDMLVNGPWALADLKAALGDDLGVIMLPAGPSGPAMPLNGIVGWFINPNSTQPAAVVDLALWMTNQENSQLFSDSANHVPVRNDVIAADPLVNTFALASAQGEVRPQIPQLDNYWGPFQAMGDDVLAGYFTPRVAVNRACQEMNVLNGLPPTFSANLNVWQLQNMIHGYNWPLDTLVSLIVRDDLGFELLNTTDTSHVASWDPNLTTVEFNLDGIVNLLSGYEVTLDGGGVTKSMIYPDIQITSIDVVTDIISGTAPAGIQIDIFDNGKTAFRHTTASDPDGIWSVDFSAPGVQDDEQTLFDLQPGSQGIIMAVDTDGDGTGLEWRVPTPRIDVWYADGNISAYEWPMSTELTLSIDDPATPDPVDFSVTTVVGPAGWDPSQTLGQFNLNGDFEMTPGMTVAVSGASISKDLLIPDLAVTFVDVAMDTITGTAPAGAQVLVGDRDKSAIRHVTASDPGGVWNADFSIPGSQGDENTTYDILPGTQGFFMAFETDGDAAGFNWQAPDPRIDVWYREGNINAYGWPVGTHLILEIDGPSIPGSPDHTTYADVTGDANGTLAQFSLNGAFEITAGMTVTVAGASLSRELLISDLTITSIDIDTDVISGTTEPNQTMWMYLQNSGTCCRNFNADPDGVWMVDYSVEDPSGQPIVDIGPGSAGVINAKDNDGDNTSLSWSGTGLPFAYGLNGPFGMVFDADDNLYIANEGGGYVTRVVPDGAQATFSDGYIGSSALAVNSSGDIYVSDDTNRVFVLDGSGNQTEWLADSLGLQNPNAIAFDSADNLFVVSAGGFVSKFDPAGQVINFSLATGLSTPQGIVVDNTAGEIFVSDWNGKVFRINAASGARSLYANTWTHTDGGLARDTAGNIYLSAIDQGMVLRIDSLTQEVTTCLYGLDRPRGLAFDPSGRLYVTEYNAGRVLRVDGCVDNPPPPPTPNPSFSVRLTENQVHGYEWILGDPVTLNIDTDHDGTDDYTDTQPVVVADFDPNQSFVRFDMPADLTLSAGMIVSMTQGALTKTHTVYDLAVENVNPDTDTISGRGEANLVVWVDVNGKGTRRVTADSGGAWSADFSIPGDEGFEVDPVDIVPGDNGEARQNDLDGDTTQSGWRLLRPYIEANAGSHWVHARDWPNGTDLLLTIDDPTTPEPVDYSIHATMGQASWNPGDPNDIVAEFDLAGFDMKPGQILMVTDEGVPAVERTLTISSLSITNYDLVTRTISGTGTPGRDIQVCVNQPGNCAYRLVTADEITGMWTADYSDIFLQAGNNGWAYEQDPAGNQTWADLRIPNPSFNVRANNDQIETWEWPTGSNLTVNIYQAGDETPPADHTVSGTVTGPSGGDPRNYLSFNLYGEFDIQPGDLVIVSDGATTKRLTVNNLAFDVMDIDTDTVSGFAPAGSRVDTWACDNTGCYNRHVTTDPDGHWLANWSTPGLEGDENNTFDLVGGTWVDSSVSDDDGDSTMYGKNIPSPYIEVAPYSGWIHARDWPLDADITMTIDDPSTPETNPDITDLATVQQNPDNPGDPNDIAAFFNWPASLAPGAGYIITMTDGTTEKTYTTTNLRVVSYDMDADTISGTADPYGDVQICVNIPGNCVSRYVTADESGNWTVDYHTPGTGKDDPATVDIILGTNGWASERTDYRDQTWYDWEAQIPACAPGNSVTGKVFLGDGTTPIENATVNFEDFATHELLFNAFSGPDGSYGCSVPVGNYRIWAIGGPMSREYYNNTIYENADNVEIAVDTQLTDVDFSLEVPIFGYQSITFNMVDPIIGQLAVRQAIAYGTDRARMTAATYPAGAIPDSYLPSIAWNYPGEGDGLPIYAYDPVEARTILENAGWLQDDGDGIRAKDGVRLHIEYYATQYDNPDHPRSRLGPIFVQNMADIGIEIDVHSMPDFSFVFQTPRPYGIVAIGWGGIDLNDDAVQDYMGQTYATGNTNNWGDYSSPAADALLVQAAGETTRAGMLTYLQQHQVQVMTDLAFLPLVEITGNFAPIPSLHVNLSGNEVHGHEWPAGVDVTLMIDSDADPENGVLYSETKNPDDDPWCGYPCFDLNGIFTLQAGQQVTMSNGGFTKTVQVSTLAVTGMDIETDIISGTATPGSTVSVDFHNLPEPVGQVVTANGSGDWAADFAGIYDLKPGNRGRAIELNPGGGDDGTLEYWNVSYWTDPVVPLILALPADFDLGAPLIDPDQIAIQNLLNEPLFRAKQGGGVDPATATGYTLSPDGLVYTITLRADAKWSDNTPLTAQHFVDGFIHLLDPAFGDEYGSYLIPMVHNAQAFRDGSVTDPGQVGITALNTLTLQFTLDEPAAFFPMALTFQGFLPIRADVISAHPTDWTSPANYVSNGPYRLLEHDQAHFLLERNPYYHGASRVVFPMIGIAIYPFMDDGINAYQNGDIDILPHVPYDLVAAIPTLLADIRALLQPGVYYLGLTQFAPTDNLNVRKALASAIDRSAVIGVANNPYLLSANGVITPELAGYQGEDVGYSYNPVEARAYLAAAGYPDGAGFPELVITTTFNHETKLQEIAQQWRTVLNIPVRVNVVDAAGRQAVLSDCAAGVSTCSTNVFHAGWFLDYPDANNTLTDLFLGGINATTALTWSNQQYIDAMALSRTELDPAQRLTLLQQAEDILVTQDAPVIPIFFYNDLALVRAGIILPNEPNYGHSYAYWGNMDADSDGLHDMVDPCPSDVTNTCNTAGSTSGILGPDGGSLVTPNSGVNISVPAGALSNEVGLTVTDGGGGFQVSTDLGQMIVFYSATLGPQGTSFATPITVTLHWLDADSDGVVDGTTVNEAGLYLSKDGVVLAGPCSTDPACALGANTFNIQVSSLSYFAIGTIDTTPPEVLSVLRASADPTYAESVDFTVTFSEVVTGVDAGDFILYTTGVTGATISDVSGFNTTYTVTVDTGSGNGTIRLDVDDDDSIINAYGNPLGGLGEDNGDYAGDESYTIAKEFTLTIISANGTITRNPNQAVYHNGDIVQLIAIENTNWSFSNWSGDLTGSANPATITITGDTTITAHYAYPGLNAYWRFDEASGNSATDSAGTNDGVVTGATWTTGQVGGALNFNGTSDYVQVPNAPALNPQSQMTLEGWVYIVEDGRDIFKIVDKDGYWSDQTGYSAHIGATGQEICIELWNPVRFLCYAPPGGFPDQTWTHFAFTYDGSQIKLFYNGDLVNSVPTSGPINQGANRDLYIGREDSRNEFMKGKIDELAIYDRALAASEIQQHFQNGLASYWQFDEGSGTIANDTVGGNHGVVTGATWTTGQVGGALNFNGASDYVQVPNAPALNPQSQMTLEGWVYIVEDGRDIFKIVDKDGYWSDQTGYSAHIGATGQEICIELWNPVRFLCYAPPGGFPDQTWVHFAFTYDGSQIKLFYNGDLANSVLTSGPINQGANRDLYIGREDGLGEFMNGKIDELAIYDRVLIAGEIQQHYQNGLAGLVNIPAIYPVVSSIVSASPNPTGAGRVDYTVTFSKVVTGVDATDFTLTTSGLTDAAITGVSGSGSTYTVSVDTGTGSGTLRLNVSDDDSIHYALLSPLGGAGSGNGNYTAGETYNIDKTPPEVVTILRDSADPSYAASVDYTVTFSEAVTDVDAADFEVVDPDGTITDASITEVSGSGTTYVVTVDTGTGSGTLRLDVVDNDTILDLALNQLGGFGEGNGNYVAGEAYTIDKTAPSVDSILLASDNPTSAASVEYSVTFSEVVTGVDVADFNLVDTSGDISGVSIIAVSGTGTTYVVTVDTGTGSGTLRLDVYDNDTIIDHALDPLGGAGEGNGNYTSGEEYNTDKTPPSVVSSLRSSVDPSHASSVDFTVTFSEPVTGVDAADFTTTVTGLTSSVIMNVTPITVAPDFETTYTVTVSTGSSSGTIRLNVQDNNTIIDALGNPLGGTGIQNYTSGQYYTIAARSFDKMAPANNSVDAATNQIISWGTSDGATSYEYCIDITLDDSCDAGDWISTGTSRSVNPAGLLPGTTYNWQVRSVYAGVYTYANSGSWWSLSTRAASGPGAWDDTNSAWMFVSASNNWINQFSTSAYNGSYRYSNRIGSSASIWINGPSFSLVYTSYSIGGVYEVFIDGVSAGTLDTYSSPTKWNQIWNGPIMAPGVHLLQFVHKSGSYIIMDAIKVWATPLTTPAAITTFGAAMGSTDGSVDLSWTAVGSDGLTGTATAYEVRYSSVAITTDILWNSATLASGSPTPKIAGSSETMTVTGLTPNATYYFAVRAINNTVMGGLSNSPSAVAKSPASGPGTYDDNHAYWIYTSEQNNWSTSSSSSAYNGSYHTSNRVGSSATYFLNSQRFTIIYATYSLGGVYEVFIDNVSAGTIDTYSATTVWQQSWNSPVLTPGVHTARFVHRSGSYVVLDAIKVWSAPFTIPAAIATLNALAGTYNGNVDLTWTSVGSDGMTGTASSYQVRYSTAAITSDSQWAAATPVTTGVPIPSVANSAENMTVRGLTFGTKYYFAIRAANNVGAMGGLSNTPFAYAKAIPANAGVHDDSNPNWICVSPANNWNVTSSASAYNGSYHTSNRIGSSATFLIYGPGFSVMYTAFSLGGVYDVLVDGVSVGTINTYSATSKWKQSWDSSSLTPDVHTVKLVHLSGGYVILDAITVWTAPHIPAAITTLTAVTGSAGGTVDLAWTAVGDDGTTGQATSYYVRYSTAAITDESLWGSATPVTNGVPSPKIAGSSESMTVNSLTPGVRYYFVVRAINNVPTMGALSNNPSAVAKVPALTTGTYENTHAYWIYTSSGNNWTTSNSALASGGSYSISNRTGSSATILMSGPSFNLNYTSWSLGGVIEVFVDGISIGTINTYATSTHWQQSWSSGALATNGVHTVQFVHKSGSYFIMDAIQIQ